MKKREGNQGGSPGREGQGLSTGAGELQEAGRDRPALGVETPLRALWGMDWREERLGQGSKWERQAWK